MNDRIYNSRWIYVPFNDSYELAYLTGNTYEIFIAANNEIDGLNQEMAEYICTLHNATLTDKGMPTDLAGPVLDMIDKERWIQKAKALLFDFTCSSAEATLKDEARKLLAEGGGYNPMEESLVSPLKWGNSDQ